MAPSALAWAAGHALEWRTATVRLHEPYDTVR